MTISNVQSSTVAPSFLSQPKPIVQKLAPDGDSARAEAQETSATKQAEKQGRIDIKV